MMPISIRKLTASDWQMLAGIRLKALHSDPLVFGSNYETEAAFTEADWRQRLAAPENSAIFVLFDGETPIGMTGVAVDRDDPTNRSAFFWGSWLAPDYRGRGFSKLMYEARIEWARAHPTVRRFIVSHRASNVASKYANRKHGFVFTHAREKTWVDGVTEDEVCYELILDA